MHAAKTDTGRAIRDTQIALFEVRESDFLQQCRTLAVEIARRTGRVSINEIRAQVDCPTGVHPSVFGAVFRDRRFVAVDYTEATHPEAHARAVRVYALREVN